MNHRLALAFVVVVAAAVSSCDACDERTTPSESAEKSSAPPPPPPALENAAKDVAGAADEPVGGRGAAAAPARSKKADAAGSVGDVGRSAIRFFKTLFDGDTLIVQRNGVRRVACDRACALEEQCGFRDVDACRAASCDDDVRRPSRMDYCLALDSSVTCLDAATCSCNESCWKRGECAGDHDHDAECERSCLTLVKHEGISRYRENRCVLESGCAEIAACSAL